MSEFLFVQPNLRSVTKRETLERGRERVFTGKNDMGTDMGKEKRQGKKRD